MGTVTVSGQLVIFGGSLLLGAVLCTVYDLFRAFRKRKNKNAVAVFFEDLLFSLIALMLTASYMLLTCKGEVRGYVLFGETVGFFACRLLLSRFIITFYTFILKAFALILTLICKPLGAFFTAFGKCEEKIGKLFKKAPIFIKKHLERRPPHSV